jgi:hypothetical protein
MEENRVGKLDLLAVETYQEGYMKLRCWIGVHFTAVL